MDQAVLSGDTEAVRRLLPVVDPDGRVRGTPYVMRAVQTGGLEMVEAFADAGADLDATPDAALGWGAGTTALHDAVVRGAPDLVHFLLERGAAADGVAGHALLHRALDTGKEAIARDLIAHGASLTAARRPDCAHTPLRAALNPVRRRSGQLAPDMTVYRRQVRLLLDRLGPSPEGLADAITARTPPELLAEVDAAQRPIFDTLEQGTSLPLGVIQHIGRFIAPPHDAPYPPIDTSDGRYRFA